MDALDYLQIAVGVPAALGAIALVTSLLCWPFAHFFGDERVTWQLIARPSDPTWKHVAPLPAVWSLAASLMRPAAILSLVTWPLVIVLAFVAD